MQLQAWRLPVWLPLPPPWLFEGRFQNLLRIPSLVRVLQKGRPMRNEGQWKTSVKTPNTLQNAVLAL
jgi:hypothetical protein